MKQILLFDIDRTIFDTDKQNKLLKENILKVANSKAFKKLDKIYSKYKKSITRKGDYIDYRPEDLSKFISKSFEIVSSLKIQDVYYAKKYNFIYKDSIYKDFLKILPDLYIEFVLGIYSEGYTKFQNHKFKSMGISKYFDPNLIFIVPAKDTPEVLSKIPKEAIIVDDKERICELLTQNGIKAIWLNKNNERKSEKFTTIHKLTDLPQCLDEQKTHFDL